MNDILDISTDNARANEVHANLNKWNEDISEADRQSKYCKMASTALVFYRGTNHLFWADFASDERLLRFGNEETDTWIQGDLHIYNYGSFANAKNEVVYDFNDFDEAIIADYQYDLWRMAVSIVLAAEQNGDLSDVQQAKVIDTFSHSYLDTLALIRKKRLDKKGFSAKHNSFGNLQYFLRRVEQQYSREGMLDRWAPKAKGKRCFDLERKKLAEVTDKERNLILEAMPAYRERLGEKLAKNDAYFEVKDIARRLLAGTGSLGVNRYYVLIAGNKDNDQNQYRILDIKRQTKPTAYAYLGDQAQRKYAENFKNDAQRHAEACKMLNRRTDKHLGWLHLDGDNLDFPTGFYSVRERSPFKEAFPGEVLDTRTSFSAMAQQWAEILAANHARANKELPTQVHRLVDDQEDIFRELVREIALLDFRQRLTKR